MTVSSVSAATTTQSAINSAASSAGISSTDFLTLLVGELQNQDPLDPTSTSDFINQMSQYATFDQQQTLNTNLSTLLTSFNSLLTLNAVNYIGHTVEAKGDTATLQNGQAAFGYSLSSAAASVNLSIQDSTGKTVWTGTGPTQSGLNTITWEGTDSSGNQLSDGQYSLTVSALDANGNSVLNYQTFFGQVTDVENTTGTTTLNVGGTSVNTSDVVAVK
ncbi:flagellar hook assembly protein FlgD [Rhodoplanes sp. Z2-YC6860]|uniref:flagellar hook assembly protein FlgD n=1 Tax=Rhodoplanes sp. Z2-YC6860 TaxID=674703 RepID=UPI00078DB533|nr:flagellar hook capping FlgD N-terminal domain-containing protein [Rhodoplanes sp. Z2-YC6860]AMN39090.1 basal-body rod modification protein FlgD [Rhodoplanes sp. Z2-YC6860]